MTLIEFITFIAAMLFLVISGRNKRQRGNPEEVDTEEQEKAERLKEFLQSVNMDKKESRMPSKQLMKTPSQNHAQAHRKTEKQKPLQTAKEVRPVEHPQPVTKNPYAYDEKPIFDHATKDAYAQVKQKKSRAYNLIRHLRNPQEMILLHEIIGPPKAMKQEGPYGDFPR